MSPTRTCLSCLLLLISAFWSFADSDDDLGKLERQVAQATGKARLELLIELASAYDARDSAKQVEYAREAAGLARTLGSREDEARALFQKGCGHLDRGENEEALDGFSRALAIFEALELPRNQFDCIKDTGWVYENMGELDLAMEQYQHALQLAREIGFESGEAVALQYIGVIHVMQNRLDTAVDYLLQALTIQERLGETVHIANVQSCLGSVYCELKSYDKALALFQKSLQVYQSEGNLQNLAIATNNIGIVYRKTDRPAEAITWYEKSLAIAEDIGDLAGIGRALSNLANCYADLNDIEASRRYDNRALDVWRQVGNTIGIADSLGNLGEGYLRQGKYPLALRHLSDSVAIAEQAEDHKLLQSGFTNLSLTHEAMGDYKQALAELRRSTALSETIMNAEVQETIAGLEAQYEGEKNRHRIEVLERDLQIHRLQLSRARFRSAAILSGFLALALLFAFYFRRYLHLLAFWKRKNYVSHYKLDRQLGSGGMGVVYQASDLMSKGRSVAIKVIRDDLSDSAEQRQRFLNEAYLVDKLNHPNIIKVFERGEHQRTLWIAMELLQGRTLAQVISEGDRLPIDSCVAVISHIADALAQIHGQGIVHRDVKPENIMVIEDDHSMSQVKLLDFGLAKSPSLTRLTEVGEILGTVTYLAPEQITNHQVLPAGDIYALGVVFYEMLTLEKPFWGGNPGEIVRAILDANPVQPILLRTELPTGLNELIMRMLNKVPGLRPSGADIVAALAT